MPISAETVKLLMQAGLQGQALIDVVASIDRDMAVSYRKLDVPAERRRAWDRERKRRLPNYDTWNALREHVFSRDGHGCVYCGSVKRPFHLDHVIPLSRGGSSDPNNLVTSCAACNIAKGAKTPDEWRRQ